MSLKQIYLDYAATTPMAPEAAKAMALCLTHEGYFANPASLQHSFGEHAYNLNISATKSMTGHCLGAAGVIETIACIQAVIHDIVPPTINHFTDDPTLDPKLNFTFNTPQKRVVNAALSNTFGFGGHNACVIVKKFIA